MPADQGGDAGRLGVLLVDDDEAMLQSMGRALRAEEVGVPILCADPRNVESILKERVVGTVLLDLVMPHMGGETVLHTILRECPDVPVIIVTATDDVDTAVRCVKAGAFDYLVKPVNFSRLFSTIARALRQWDLRTENLRLRKMVQVPELNRPECFAGIITQSPAMHALFRYIEAIAPSPEPVLIVGETGVGKELVAQAVHRVSGRMGELVSVNAAGIDESAFADTLFGHVRGAFTGADRSRQGMIERTGRGTLFLDEVGDMGMEMQTKLLRLLQEGEYFPLGSDRCCKSDARILAATHHDLRTRMRQESFREDLYYRLHAHMVRVPPLRERPGDIELLLEHFLQDAAAQLNKPIPTCPKELPIHLKAYEFPGNVRELRAMVYDAVARHDKGILSLRSFHEHMDEAIACARRHRRTPVGTIAAWCGHEIPTLEAATGWLIEAALKNAAGNQGAAARMLGISRRTVSRYLQSRAGTSSENA